MDTRRRLCTLPHDGMNAIAITGLKYADHLRDAGFKVDVVANQGVGAAAQRIEAVRRLFPKCWFNEATTEAGRDALGYYLLTQQEMTALVPELDPINWPPTPVGGVG